MELSRLPGDTGRAAETARGQEQLHFSLADPLKEPAHQTAPQLGGIGGSLTGISTPSTEKLT